MKKILFLIVAMVAAIASSFGQCLECPPGYAPQTAKWFFPYAPYFQTGTYHLYATPNTIAYHDGSKKLVSITDSALKVRLGFLTALDTNQLLATKRYVDSLVSAIDTPGLQAVLNAGNTASSNITLNGNARVNNMTVNSLGNLGVVFSSTGGQLVNDTAAFVYDRSNKWLGIGTPAPISSVHVIGSNASFIGERYNGSGTSGALTFRSAAGTEINKTAQAAGITIFNLNGQGYSGSAFASGFSFLAMTDEPWSPSTIGANFRMSWPRTGTIGSLISFAGKGTGNIYIGAYTTAQWNALINTGKLTVQGESRSGPNILELRDTTGFVTTVFTNTRRAGIGTITPAASSILEVASIGLGVLLPRMTNAQKTAIASPATGLTLYCTDCTATDASTGVMQTYNGTTWKNHW